MILPDKLPDKMDDGWPAICQRSWLQTFQQWHEDGGRRVLSPRTVENIYHALHYNLLYIERLEMESTQ